MEKAGELMGQRVHVRRCHVCGALMEKEGALVEQCTDCGKHLAPFYYFNERLAMKLVTEAEASRSYKSTALPRAEYPPIWGLTAYWDNEEAVK